MCESDQRTGRDDSVLKDNSRLERENSADAAPSRDTKAMTKTFRQCTFERILTEGDSHTQTQCKQIIHDEKNAAIFVLALKSESSSVLDFIPDSISGV